MSTEEYQDTFPNERSDEDPNFELNPFSFTSFEAFWRRVDELYERSEALLRQAKADEYDRALAKERALQL